MADMRLIVVGAGGRMGRTLIQRHCGDAGVALAGAVERPVRRIGHDAGVLAGLAPNGVHRSMTDARRCWQADAIIDFTSRPRASLFAGLAAQSALAHVIGTTGLSPADEAS